MERKKEKDKGNSLLVYSEGRDNPRHLGYISQDALKQSHQVHRCRLTKASGEG